MILYDNFVYSIVGFYAIKIVKGVLVSYDL